MATALTFRVRVRASCALLTGSGPFKLARPVTVGFFKLESVHWQVATYQTSSSIVQPDSPGPPGLFTALLVGCEAPSWDLTLRLVCCTILQELVQLGVHAAPLAP